MWLAEGLDNGHCKASPLSTTFNSPRLSAAEEYRVRHVEVWGLKEPDVDPNREQAGQSILDKSKEDQVLLEWVGREQQSKAIRDGPGAQEVLDDD